MQGGCMRRSLAGENCSIQSDDIHAVVPSVALTIFSLLHRGEQASPLKFNFPCFPGLVNIFFSSTTAGCPREQRRVSEVHRYYSLRVRLPCALRNTDD